MVSIWFFIAEKPWHSIRSLMGFHLAIRFDKYPCFKMEVFDTAEMIT